MSRGATIQFMKILNRIWIQTSFLAKTWWRVSNCTLQRIGYIITSSPIANYNSTSATIQTINFIHVLTYGNRDADELSFLECRASIGNKVS
jgi:hypothetical protein